MILFWSVFEEHRPDSTTTYYNGTIFIIHVDNVIVLSDLVESSGYCSKTLQKGSCPYMRLWTRFYGIIQILTGTVMKYHVSVDLPRELYFPKGCCPEGNITILAPPTRDISSVPVDICYIRWSKWMISSKLNIALWWLPQSLGNKTRSLRTKQTECKLDSLRAFYYDVLLLTTAYCADAVYFFLGQFPNMELMLLFTELLNMFPVASRGST